MRTRRFVIAFATLSLITYALPVRAQFEDDHINSGASHPVASIQDAETAAQRDARMRWWREARFGMFIHWGLYAVPAGTWNGQTVPDIGEWIMNTAKVPVADYEQLAARFNPTKFDVGPPGCLLQHVRRKPGRLAVGTFIEIGRQKAEAYSYRNRLQRNAGPNRRGSGRQQDDSNGEPSAPPPRSHISGSHGLGEADHVDKGLSVKLLGCLRRGWLLWGRAPSRRLRFCDVPQCRGRLDTNGGRVSHYVRFRLTKVGGTLR